MTPRSISLVLTSLSTLMFATSVFAGEVSMDVRGLSADSEQPQSLSRTSPAEASAEATESGTTVSESSSRNKWNLATPGHQVLITDGAEAGAVTSSSAGSASSNAIAAPVKSRNRWQFLVPGAIK
ncbi:MAG: hypothetical protein ABIR27_02625 [Dokdonella sp.]